MRGLPDSGDPNVPGEGNDVAFVNWRDQGQPPTVRPRQELVPRHIRDFEVARAWTADTRMVYGSEILKTGAECMAENSALAETLVRRDPGIAPGLRLLEADYIDSARYLLRSYMTGPTAR